MKKSLIIIVCYFLNFSVNAQENGPFVLWDENVPFPSKEEIPVLDNVEFSVIKPYEFYKDGYRFLHGVAVIWYKDKIYASFGHNKNGENTVTEEANYRVSKDGGKTWGAVKRIGGESNVAVSHGEFLKNKGKLWAFHGEYDGTMQNLRMRAFQFKKRKDKWIDRGIVCRNNFWPLVEPVKMDDGNWIVAGIQVNSIGAGNNPPAVAISKGDNFLEWEVVVIPMKHTKVWGESTLLIDGKSIVNIARWGGKYKALASKSEDYGKTWSELKESNLPMVSSKVYSGQLSTGEYYAIGTMYKGVERGRNPLTIAMSEPNKMLFSKLYIIRNAVFEDGPGESHPKAALSYPHAYEHKGKLYVGYSNDGGKVGRDPGKTLRESWNNNSGELAIIPLEELRK